MRFAVSSVLYILASQLAAGAAVPETRDIVFETTIHQDESKGTIHQDGSKGTLDHKVLDIMSQKGDYNADATCQEYGHSCLPGQCCPGLSCITVIFGFGGWCW